MTVVFRLLGQMAASRDGRSVELGPARQRCVLAALLVDANRAIPTGQLVERVWGPEPPERAAGALHSYLSRLRRAFADADVEPVTIERQPAGYVLTVDEQAVDLHRFQSLVRRARGSDQDDAASAWYAEALGLWQGDEAFPGADSPWLDAVRERLARERFAVELDRNDLLLRQGRHAEVLPELPARVAEHPLDERLAGQVMLALYRGGRAAEALEQYRQTRQRLADELDIGPGPQLQRLHQRILAGDPTLSRPADGGGHTPAEAAPRQLPATSPVFIGRARELAQLTATGDEQARQGAMAICAIVGPGGIGKTALALHWAAHNGERFPDGQLYANLRGFDPSGQPAHPGTVLHGFLDALGVPRSAIPRAPDAQAGLFRTVTADKRILVVLDNARDTAQITPLLPGGPASTVLVTSRQRLDGLRARHDAPRLDLDALSDVQARELLGAYLGTARIDAEPDAVATLVTCCAGLPLALSIAAARAAATPSFPLRALADELQDHTIRLDAMDAGDQHANLRAVLSWSYHTLDRPAATVFELLALAPGPDIGVPAAARLTGRTESRCTVLLRQLANAHLVQQYRPYRYRMHDLVRLYAAEQAGRHQPAAGRDAALGRLLGFYLGTAYTGERLLAPHRRPIELTTAHTDGHSLPDTAAALDWFDVEHPCLLAAQQLAAELGWHRLTWELGWSLITFQERRGHFHDNVTAWRTALAAAEHLDDPTATLVACHGLGLAAIRTGDLTTALDYQTRAATIAEDIGDTLAQAKTHRTLAATWERRGDYQQALSHSDRALRLARSLGDPIMEAEGHNAVGWDHAHLGNYAEARAACQAALALCRAHDDRDEAAAALDSLGYIAHRTDRHAEAVDWYQQAIALLRELGNGSAEAAVQDHLGDAWAALGRPAEAEQAWQQAFDLFQAQRRTQQADQLQEKLANLRSPGPVST